MRRTIMLVVSLLGVTAPLHAQPAGPPARDAVADAQTPKAVDRVRPEQRLTDHDRSGEFPATAAPPSSSAFAHQPNDDPIKTFTLRGIKDSPPYLHDGRCFTLEDTVEVFTLVLGLRLVVEEKRDLVAFMRQL